MDTTTFQKYILPAIIGGAFVIAGILITYTLNKNDNKLSSKEKTEIKNPDGTITKREMEIYK